MQDHDTVRLPLLSRHGAIVGYAVVDAPDGERLSRYRWRVFKAAGGKLYAGRSTGAAQTRVNLFLHREIMGLPPKQTRGGIEVDHVNRDGLDNRRENLRIVTHAQNLQNKPAYRNCQSGERGVYWHKLKSRWAAQGTLDGKQQLIGLFAAKADAVDAARNWRREYMPFATN